MESAQQPTYSPEQRPVVFPKFVSLFLGILTIIGGVTTFMMLKDASGFKSRVFEANKQQAATQSSWNHPTSTHQAIPVLQKDNGQVTNFSMYDLTTKKLQSVNKKIIAGGGIVGLGSIDPLSSPDMMYTAIIDDKKNIWIVSHDSLTTTQVSNTGNAAYLTAWSPNSTKLVYYVAKDTLDTRRQTPVTWEQKETFSHNENTAAGFLPF